MSCLRIDENGRFELDGVSLHSGDYLEIRVGVRMRCGQVEEDIWIQGRVEHSADGYYFVNPAGPNFPLYAGIQGRLPQGGSPYGQSD